MNPQRAKHLNVHEGGRRAAAGADNEGKNHKPSFFVHSHSNGHTVHVFHNDGAHEKQEHGHDTQSVEDHVHELLHGGESDEGGEGEGANNFS